MLQYKSSIVDMIQYTHQILGLRKTVFETEEQKRLHRNPFKQKSLSGYKKDQAQQVQAAKNLGDNLTNLQDSL